MSDKNVSEIFAAYAKNNKLRIISSSGGLFSLFAKNVLDKAGIVYGVAMSEDCKYAEYIRVDAYEDLSRLQGSKYLQAKIGETYKKTKEDLDSGKLVLFTGTSCQVNGLKCFLKKDYYNLYCIDLICHGVPSPKLWRQYVKYMEQQRKGQLVKINFRYKKESQVKHFEREQNNQRKVVYTAKNNDPYMNLFLKNYCLRPSCYSCIAKTTKMADITIGDFWGIEDVYPDMNDGKGVSVVFVRTEKGKQIFEQISTGIIARSVTYEEGIKKNPSENSSSDRPEEREYFFEDMNKMEFEMLKDKYVMMNSHSILKATKRVIKKIVMYIRLYRNSNQIKNSDYGLLWEFKQTKD